MTRGPLLRPEPVGQELVGLKHPPDWDQIFGFSGPLELEIGCGPGHFALEHCARHPGVRYVAFEWRKKYIRELAHRAEQRGLKNLKAVEADAREEVPRLFAGGSLAGIHLQFPDPWWKRAHHKRAVLQPDFARLLFGFTVPGGYFDLRTDVAERAHQMLSVLEEAGLTRLMGQHLVHRRARRYLGPGEPVFRARLLKPAAPGA